MLNLGCGPARDISIVLSQPHHADIQVDCVERDPNAIAYAKEVCREHASQVNFIQGNVLTYCPQQGYELVWAGGLFDYFNDRVFRPLLRRTCGCIAPTGEVVVGNFSVRNPNVGWMRFCCWEIHRRTEAELLALAAAIGTPPHRMSAGSEPAGVNLFLHIVGEEREAPTTACARIVHSRARWFAMEKRDDGAFVSAPNSSGIGEADFVSNFL